MVNEKTDSFDNMRKELTADIEKSIKNALTILNEKEDRSKTLIQAGNATVNNMNEIVIGIFDQDFPLVDGGNLIGRYLIQMFDKVKQYTSTKNQNEFPAIKADFEDIAKKALSRIKRLISRLKSEEEKNAYKEIEKKLIKLIDDSLQNNGVFSSYQEYLLIDEKVKQSQTLFTKESLNFKKALKTMLNSSDQFNEQAQRQAKEKTLQAKKSIGIIILAGLLIGIFSAARIIRSITQPLNSIVKFSRRIAEGDLLLEDLTAQSSYEIALLTETMNQMKNNLKQNFEEIKSARQKDMEIIDGLKHAIVIIKKIGEGDLTQVIDINSKGIIGELADSINQMKDKLDNSFIEIKNSQQRDQEVINGLSRAMILIKKIGEGDFTQKLDISSGNIVGDMAVTMNKLLIQLSQIIYKIRESANAIGSSSQQIAASNNNLAEHISEQAASLEETASSMTEMNAIVQSNSENAQNANKISQKTSSTAENGRDKLLDAVKKVIEGNRKTLEQLLNLNKEVIKAMADISSRSEKVSGITALMEDISFQTNLLSLNAAVEAARAGEHGKGFAVVAAEVRNLAWRASKASKQINNLISDSLERIKKGRELVDISDQSLQMMRKNTEGMLNDLLTESGKNLDEILNAVNALSNMVENISAASVEQATGINQINKSILDMDKLTQKNATLIEETSAASKSMAEEAVNLVQLIKVFKINDQLKETTAQIPDLINNEPKKQQAISIEKGLPDFD